MLYKNKFEVANGYDQKFFTFPGWVYEFLGLNASEIIPQIEVAEMPDGSLTIRKSAITLKEKIAQDYLDLYSFDCVKYNMGFRKISAAIFTCEGDILVGSAQCNANDEFNETVGKAIALARAFGEKPDPRLID